MPDKRPRPAKPEPVERLRQLRLDRDWTNRRVAQLLKERTGINRTEGAMRNILDGDSQPRARTLNAIVKFLAAEDKAESELVPQQPLLQREAS